MDERIIDREREIKVKCTKEGVDATDALADETAEEAQEEEVILEAPDEELGSEFEGYSPAEVREELERRAKARKEAEEECKKLTEEGEEALKAEKFEEAEERFAQALAYDPTHIGAGKGLWTARTKGFTVRDCFMNEEHAEEFSVAPEEVRAFVLNEVGGPLDLERRTVRAEIAPLKEKVLSEQEKRRAPFLANRKYYLMRFAISGFSCLAFLIAAAICSGFLYRTNSYAPLVLTIVFAVISFAALVFVVVFTRKLILAQRLCRANEELQSTEDGALLEEKEGHLYCLNLVLDGKQQNDE